MTANPEQVPDEPVCPACGGRGDLHNDDCVSLAMGIPVCLQIGDGDLEHIGALTPTEPVPLGLALAEFLKGFAKLLEEKYAEELLSGHLNPDHPSMLEWVVLRPDTAAPQGWLPEYLDGRWLPRWQVSLPHLAEYPLWYRAGEPVDIRLEETETVEEREGSLAQVWRVVPG